MVKLVFFFLQGKYLIYICIFIINFFVVYKTYIEVCLVSKYGTYNTMFIVVSKRTLFNRTLSTRCVREVSAVCLHLTVGSSKQSSTMQRYVLIVYETTAVIVLF